MTRPPLAMTPLVLLAGATARLPAQDPHAELAQVRAAVGFDPVPGVQVPTDVRFVSDAGDDVTLGECIGGRPTVLALVYYHCPMLCNEVVASLTESLRAVQLEPGVDYSVVLLGIDPAEEPADAARRREKILSTPGHVGGEGWSFLTGRADAIDRIADAVGFRYRYLPESDEFAHAAGICVLGRDGVLTRAFRGIDYPARDLQLALVDSARGEIGSVTDRVLLLCYAWDPTTGRYGLAILSLLRIGGLLTAIAIAAGIAWMIRSDRRRIRRREAT